MAIPKGTPEQRRAAAAKVSQQTYTTTTAVGPGRPPAAAGTPPVAVRGDGQQRATKISGAGSLAASSKIDALCAGMMEAGWIAAVMVTPLFFNPYSEQTFEPDKINVLRSIAWFIAIAWVLQLLERRGRGYLPPRALLAVPLVIPVVAFVGATLIGTAFSVAPWLSFWGGHIRSEGTYTLLAYVLIFTAVAVHMRRREQLERLISAIITVSFAVSLYGVIQRQGWDPVSWGSDVSSRVTSTLGNSIFIGAYLIMAMPLTVVRALQSFLNWRRDGRNRSQLLLVLYAIIGLLQLTALYLSDSRGPWAGLAVGMLLFVILVSVLLRPRWTLPIMGLATAGCLLVVLLNVPSGPLQPLRQVRGLSSISNILQGHNQTSVIRELIWTCVSQMMLPHAPIVDAEGRTDALNNIRTIVGYGPETMYEAYNQFYPADIGHYERGVSWDRPHNETWHAFYAAGLFGLLTYTFLFGSVFFFGLRWLGLLPRQRSKVFLAMYAGGGLLSVVAVVSWRGWPYLGLALPLGCLAGLFLYLLWVAIKGPFPEETEGSRTRLLIMAALLGAIAGHYVEAQFGIAMSSNWVHLWVFLGLLLVAGCLWPAGPCQRVRPRPIWSAWVGRRRRWSRQGAAGKLSWPSWLNAAPLLLLPGYYRSS